MAVIMVLDEREAEQTTSSSTDLCADTNFLFSTACCEEKPVFIDQTSAKSITEKGFYVLVIEDTLLISLENKRFKNERFFYFRMPEMLPIPKGWEICMRWDQILNTCVLFLFQGRWESP